jgi:hypothetical protein
MNTTPLAFRVMLILGGVALFAAVVTLWRGERVPEPAAMNQPVRNGTKMTGTSALSHGGAPTARSESRPLSPTQFRIGQLVVVTGADPAGVSPISLLPGPGEGAPAAGQERASRTVPPGTVAVLKSLHGSYSEIALTNGETGWIPNALLGVPDHLPDKDTANE